MHNDFIQHMTTTMTNDQHVICAAYDLRGWPSATVIMCMGPVPWPTPTGLQRTICFPFIRPTQWPVITYYWAYSIDEWVFLDLCRTAHRRITSKSPAENNNRYVYGRKFTTFSDFSISSSNNNTTVVGTSNFALSLWCTPPYSSKLHVKYGGDQSICAVFLNK